MWRDVFYSAVQAAARKGSTEYEIREFSKQMEAAQKFDMPIKVQMEKTLEERGKGLDPNACASLIELIKQAERTKEEPTMPASPAEMSKRLQEMKPFLEEFMSKNPIQEG